MIWKIFEIFEILLKFLNLAAKTNYRKIRIILIFKELVK